MRVRSIVVLSGLAIGTLVAALAPRTWLFVPSPAASDTQASGQSDTKYACPMFCVILDAPTPDGRCPVCGMELAVISSLTTLDAHERRMAGVEAARVERAPVVRSIRALGEVDYDETLVSRITTRTQGWLTDVHVDATWQSVHAGNPLAEIYSPELLAAAEEVRVADRSGDAGLVAAATRRLHLLGIDDTEIAALRAADSAPETVTLRAPRDGVVISRTATPGASVAAGADLYTIADLSHVWVQAQVFQDDLRHVDVGMPATLTVEGSALSIDGQVAFVDPVIDRRSRTARVRIGVDNPRDGDGWLLHVGGRVSVRIEGRVDAEGNLAPPPGAQIDDPLVVPRSAVLRTGRRAVVYVLSGPNDTPVDPERLPEQVTYLMVEVTLGPTVRRAGASADDLFVVLDSREPGLTTDSVIVRHGALLLDSQAQLSGRPSLLFPEGNRGAPASGATDHSGH